MMKRSHLAGSHARAICIYTNIIIGKVDRGLLRLNLLRIRLMMAHRPIHSFLLFHHLIFCSIELFGEDSFTTTVAYTHIITIGIFDVFLMQFDKIIHASYFY